MFCFGGFISKHLETSLAQQRNASYGNVGLFVNGQQTVNCDFHVVDLFCFYLILFISEMCTLFFQIIFF